MLGPDSRRHGTRRIGSLHKPEEIGHLKATERSHRDTRGRHCGNRRCELQLTKHKSQSDLGGNWAKFSSTSRRRLWRLQQNLHKTNDLSRTCKRNAEANVKVYDLNQKAMRALETLAFLYSAFGKNGHGLEQDESYDKAIEEMQEAMEKFKDSQRFAEIAQERFYDSCERFDKDFQDLQEARLKVKDANSLRNCT